MDKTVEQNHRILQPKSRVTAPAVKAGLPLRSQVREVGRFYQYRGALLLIVAALVLWMNVTFLIPLVMGAIFAIVLYPLMQKMAKWRIGITWKATIVTIFFAIIFLLPIGAIIFLGAEQALSKIQEIQQNGITANTFSTRAIIDMLGLGPLLSWAADVSPVSEGRILQFATRGMQTVGTYAITALQNFLGSLPGAMFGTLIVLLTIFFLLLDGKKAVRFIRDNSIFGPEQTDKIFQIVKQLCYSVVVASIAAGAVQSALIVIACMVTNTEGALLIGLVSFVLSFLPMLGTAPVTLFLTAQAFIRGDISAGIIFLVAIIVVGISDNIVRPYVLKGGAELHPLVGFVAAFGALDAIGFYGVFIGPVVAGLFFAMLPMVTRSYRARAKID